METKKFNELTRDFIESFIPTLSKEEKQKLKDYIEAHPRDSSSAMFAMVKSYIYNTYFRAVPQLGKTREKSTFADTINLLLEDDAE